MVRSVAAVLMLLALMVPFDAPWGASDALSGLQGVSAARREVEVGAGGDADEEDEYDDEEYDDEDYEEEDEDGAMHEPIQPVNARALYEEFSNSEMTTAMWSIVDRGDLTELSNAIDSDPDLVYLRSEDGRGPLFWAYEYERYDMVKLLLDKGADAAAVDVKGNTPVGLMGKDERARADAAAAAAAAAESEEDEEDEYEDDEE